MSNKIMIRFRYCEKASKICGGAVFFKFCGLLTIISELDKFQFQTWTVVLWKATLPKPVTLWGILEYRKKQHIRGPDFRYAIESHGKKSSFLEVFAYSVYSGYDEKNENRTKIVHFYCDRSMPRHKKSPQSWFGGTYLFRSDFLCNYYFLARVGLFIKGYCQLVRYSSICFL